jgi:tRNA threonylcarbamoyladenosine modification (KEOPS) complex  Pcc1 subunit
VGYLLRVHLEKNVLDITSSEFAQMISEELRRELRSNDDIRTRINEAVAKAIKEFPTELVVAGVNQVVQEQIAKDGASFRSALTSRGR